MKITDKISKAASFFASVALVVMLLLMMIVVIGRYVFGKVPPWSEELALFLMAWLGFLSAAALENKKEHIRISVIDKYYPRVLLNICNTIRYLIKIVFAIALTYYGFYLGTHTKGYFASVNIPIKWSFIPGGIAGLIITVILLLQVKEELIDIWKKKESNK